MATVAVANARSQPRPVGQQQQISTSAFASQGGQQQQVSSFVSKGSGHDHIGGANGHGPIVIPGQLPGQIDYSKIQILEQEDERQPNGAYYFS